MFTICSKLEFPRILGRNKKKTLPDFPPDTLSSTFDDYFHHKLTSTLNNLLRYTTLITPIIPTYSLNVCSVPSMSDIGTLLKATKSSSPLDPIPLPFYTKSLNPSLFLSIIYSVNPSNPVSSQHPINMHSLHPSLRNQTLTLIASTIIAQSQTCRYFPKLWNESSRNN